MNPFFQHIVIETVKRQLKSKKQKLHTEIDKIDKIAFIVMQSIKDAKGGMIKKGSLVK